MAAPPIAEPLRPVKRSPIFSVAEEKVFTAMTRLNDLFKVEETLWKDSTSETTESIGVVSYTFFSMCYTLTDQWSYIARQLRARRFIQRMKALRTDDIFRKRPNIANPVASVTERRDAFNKALRISIKLINTAYPPLDNEDTIDFSDTATTNAILRNYRGELCR